MLKTNYDSVPEALKALPDRVGFRVWRDEKENR
jgi:hypothetical protein